MKTLRYRIGSKVKPGILDADGNIRDASSIVSDWDADTRILEVTKITDPGFTVGEFVVGIGTTQNGSDAKYRVSSIFDQDQVDTFADNEPFETQADSILDFTESNPFGEY